MIFVTRFAATASTLSRRRDVAAEATPPKWPTASDGAQRILAHPNVWRAVTTLARDLEGWGVLTGHDSAETVEWSGRARNQLTLLLPMPRSTSRKPRRTLAQHPARTNVNSTFGHYTDDRAAKPYSLILSEA